MTVKLKTFLFFLLFKSPLSYAFKFSLVIRVSQWRLEYLHQDCSDSEGEKGQKADHRILYKETLLDQKAFP